MKSVVRLCLLAIGWLSIVLGTLGIFLPLLPTTVFLLLAAACFAKSSDRFHSWLLNNRWFGPIILDWQERRCMDPAVKRWALCAIVLSFGFSIYIIPTEPLRYFLVAGMLTCLLVVSRIPVERPGLD